MQEIILQNADNLGVALAPEAIALKEKVLNNAKSITKVSDSFSQQMATDARAEIKRITKGVEATRKEIKAPILKAGRDIDDLAENFVAELIEQDARIEKINTAYEVERRRIAQEEEAKRQAELRRLEEERQKAEAEERRKKEEADRAILNAKNKAEREEAEKKARIAEAEATEKRKALLAQTQVALQIIPEKKAEGISLRKVPKFEILDIHEVYKSNPKLVRLEANTSEINLRINQGMKDVPGMRIWEENKSGVRA